MKTPSRAAKPASKAPAQQNAFLQVCAPRLIGDPSGQDSTSMTRRLPAAASAGCYALAGVVDGVEPRH